MYKGISRRDFLKASGGLAAGGLLASGLPAFRARRRHHPFTHAQRPASGRAAALVAYGFARFRFPFRNFLFLLLLSTLMLPLPSYDYSDILCCSKHSAGWIPTIP